MGDDGLCWVVVGSNCTRGGTESRLLTLAHADFSIPVSALAKASDEVDVVGVLLERLSDSKWYSNVAYGSSTASIRAYV